MDNIMSITNIHTILGIISLIIVIMVGGAIQIYTLLDNIGKFKRKDFDEWVFFKQNWIENNYKDAKRFEQDCLIKTVGFLSSFTNKEVDFIIDKNISLINMKRLNYLFKKNLVILNNDSFLIPEKLYVYKKSLKLESVVCGVLFITLVAISIYFSIKQNFIPYFFCLGLTIIFEGIFLVTIQDILYYHAIRNELASENIGEIISVSCQFSNSLN